MILYPTETIYGLGVNAHDRAAVDELFAFKGREGGKAVSWLVRDIVDIERYANVSDATKQLLAQYLPGPVTFVLSANKQYERYSLQDDETLSFRISSDSVTQQLIADYMAEYDAPLTCTSANVSGLETAATPQDILQQFKEAGRDASKVTVVDDGVRAGQGSTVVRVVDDQVEVLRQGSTHIDLQNVDVGRITK